MTHFFFRLKKKIGILLASFLFRCRYLLVRGKIRSDYISIARCGIGRKFVVRGSISVFKSSVIFGDYCAVAETAEVAAEEDGRIVVGSRVSFGPRTIVNVAEGEIDIGSRTTFFSDCLISGSISIGKDCLFAKNVTVLSSTHQIYGDGTIRENDAASRLDPNYKLHKKITIGDDCWLGMNSVVLPGVNLGRGVVVGANAVVTKNMPEYSVVAGVPALIIGSRVRG